MMYSRFAILLSLLACCFVGNVAAQETDLSRLDFSKIRVDEITDAQLVQILQRAEREGLTTKELERVALARGMQPSEVVKFRGRINDLKSKMASGDYERERSSDSSRRDRRRLDEEDADDDDPFDVLTEERRRRASDEESERQSRDDRRRRTAEDDAFYADSTDYLTDLDSIPAAKEPKRPPIFGEHLFKSESLTFEPSLDIPTPENYQLGAGDELVIDVWGSAEMTYTLPVRRDGTVRVESLGPIHVNGLTLEEAEQRVLGRLSQLYAGLNASGPSESNVYADVSLGKIRTIKVHIVGEVTHPGSYTLPALANVLNALYVCSGPSENGTYRRIQVIRGGGVITHFDVYDFLVDGRLENNINLRDQDIIKVDPYVARVEIRGEIKRPALFEIVQGETMGDLLTFAGAFTGEAYTRRLKVYRSTETEKRIVGVALQEFSTFPLHGGDEVVVEPVLKRFENRVEIRGAVYRVGEYQLEDAPTVYQLIERSEGLRGDAFLSRGHIYRTRDDLSLEVISFDLARLMASPREHDVTLKKDDAVIIPSIFDLKQERHVEVEGSVQKQGAFPFMEQMSLRDLIVMAGGLKEEASLQRVEIARRRTGGGEEISSKIADIFYFDIERDLSLTSEAENFVLEPFDEVFVRRSPNYIEQRDVEITGEVLFPGTYTIQSKDDRVSTLIQRAGDLTPEAYPAGARLIRSHNETGPVGINLDRILQSPGSEYDLLVEDGDSIHVPLRLETVKISGAVHYPVSVRYSRGLSFQDYINSAGGPTDQADLKKAYIVSAAGSVDRLNDRWILNRSPKIEPGAEIVVPTKPDEEKMTIQERTLVLSSIVSLAAVVSTTIFQLTR